jgi:hypothetical protein
VIFLRKLRNYYNRVCSLPNEMIFWMVFNSNRRLCHSYVLVFGGKSSTIPEKWFAFSPTLLAFQSGPLRLCCQMVFSANRQWVYQYSSSTDLSENKSVMKMKNPHLWVDQVSPKQFLWNYLSDETTWWTRKLRLVYFADVAFERQTEVECYCVAWCWRVIAENVLLFCS